MNGVGYCDRGWSGWRVRLGGGRGSVLRNR